MKKQFLLIGLLSASSFVNAQSFPNGGFENWTDFTLYEEPQNWSGMNIMSMFGADPTAQKSIDAHNGTYALKLTTSVSDLGGDGEMDTIPGIIMLGNVDMMSGSGTAGYAFTARPDSLIGWYKLTSPNNDPFMLQFTSTKWDNTNQTAETIATGIYTGTAQSNYVRFSMPINYLSTSTTDTIQVYIANAMNESGVDNQLFIDDLSFVYNSTASIVENDIQFNIAPNPVVNELKIASKEPMKEIRIQDINGQTLLVTDVNQMNATIQTNELSSGMYFCTILFENGTIEQQKFMKY